jgi:T5SS/PEP-CTERM-associated repeat protein
VFQTGLEMQDGAAVRITNSTMQLLLTNDHVNIDGSLTLDSGSIDFGDTTVTARVGRATSGAFTINGGLVSAGLLTVGGLTNSSGNLVVSGGALNIATLLSVGRSPGTTGTCSIAGGQLNVFGDSRVGDGGLGQMFISNATVWVTNLDIGHDTASLGLLSVQNGGVLNMSGDLSIAVDFGSTGSVTVAGGTLAASGQRLKIGRQGNGRLLLSSGTIQADGLWVSTDLTNTSNDLTNTGNGQVTVSGGTLLLASNLFVGAISNSTGLVTINGGTLSVSNLGGNALLSVLKGSVGLAGGTLTTDNLLLTNSTGLLTFDSGTLDTKNTTVNNGTPFVVGNGTAAAVLHLSGGTHIFANGLMISSNAMLTGCGQVVGPIVNHGVIATNCNSLVPPTITGVARNGTTNSISCSSVAGQTYHLEYKNNLTDPAWTALPGSATGTGNIIVLKDTSASPPRRFYHVVTP